MQTIRVSFSIMRTELWFEPKYVMQIDTYELPKMPEDIQMYGMCVDTSHKSSYDYIHTLASLLQKYGVNNAIHNTKRQYHGLQLIVTVCVGNYIVIPDFLNILTSFTAHPATIDMILCKMAYDMKWIVPDLRLFPQKLGWYNTQLQNHNVNEVLISRLHK